MAWQLQRNIALFREYRFTHFSPDLQFSPAPRCGRMSIQWGALTFHGCNAADRFSQAAAATLLALDDRGTTAIRVRTGVLHVDAKAAPVSRNARSGA